MNAHQLLEYCIAHAAEIFVRTDKGTESFAKLRAAEALKFVLLWLHRGELPHRVPR